MADRITNEEFRKSCGVENLEHRLREMRMRWFGHVKHRDENIYIYIYIYIFIYF